MSRASEHSNEPSTVKIQSRQPEELIMQSTYTIKGGETGDIPKMAIVTATLVNKSINSIGQHNKTVELDTEKSNSSSPMRGNGHDRSPLQFKTISMPQEGIFNSQEISNRRAEKNQSDAKIPKSQFKKNNAQENMHHFKTDIKPTTMAEHNVKQKFGLKGSKTKSQISLKSIDDS